MVWKLQGSTLLNIFKLAFVKSTSINVAQQGSYNMPAIGPVSTIYNGTTRDNESGHHILREDNAEKQLDDGLPNSIHDSR